MTIVDPNVGKDFVEHFGTKGMRWGVRKQRTDSGHGKGKKDEKDGDKKTAAKPKRVTGKTNTQGKLPDNLSDAQLQKVIARMNMEQQYAKLTDPGPSKKRRAAESTKKFVLEAARGILMNQAKSAGNKQFELIKDRMSSQRVATRVASNMAKKMATQGKSFV